MLAVLGAQQYRPVILAAYPVLAARPEKFARLLRSILVIAVRATVVRVNTGDVQRANQSVAVRIARGELKSPNAIARALGEITQTDDAFRSAFAVLDVDPKGPRKRWLRYLLGELEAASGGAVIDWDVGDVSIEHVLPENPATWDAFSHEDRLLGTRLGNLTPLERAVNAQLGSAPFDAKRAAYQKSRYALTRSIVAEEWTPESIRARQAQLAELATKVWRMDVSDPS